MKTRAQQDKTELRTRAVPKRTKLQVYVEVPPRRCSRRPTPPSTLPSASQAPSQPLNRVQASPRVFTPPLPPATHTTPVAPDSRRLPSPSLPPSPQVENSPPAPLHAAPMPAQVEASRREPASLSPQPRVAGTLSAPAVVGPARRTPTTLAKRSTPPAPLPLPTWADASKPVSAIILPSRQTPVSPSPLPASALPPALSRGPPPPIPPPWTPPPIPPPWTRPRLPDPPHVPTRPVNLESSTTDSGTRPEARSSQSVSVPHINFTQVKRTNRFDDDQLRLHTAQPVHIPPVDKLFDNDTLPPSSPTHSLPHVSSPVRPDSDDDDVQPTRSLRSRTSTSKSVQFVTDAEEDGAKIEEHAFDNNYQPQEGPVDYPDEEQFEEQPVAEEDAPVVKTTGQNHSSRSKSAKSASKRQSSKGKAKAKSTAKPAPKPRKKVKKLSLYEDDEGDEDDEDLCDPEDDPHAPQSEPNASKYTHAPGPLSKECLAEVNQLVYEFDTKMNAIGRKYHKSVIRRTPEGLYFPILTIK
ncbi:hypothetical protein VKT23_016696 [Stygiomarasmius scandens]|uniref:Uncharacterized protein n=1 Tax=Marasmiellus scandens TaxID=2682957 RepID=A0ABR1IYN4_9AGAR